MGRPVLHCIQNSYELYGFENFVAKLISVLVSNSLTCSMVQLHTLPARGKKVKS